MNSYSLAPPRNHYQALEDEPFNKHSMNDGQHLSPFDEGRIDVGLDGITIRMLQGINEDDMKRVLGRSVLATVGIDATSDLINEGLPWEEMLKGGLQTALESQVVVFEVSGITRTSTHQLVRTRKAAFHQQSQRATYMGDLPNLRMPQTVYENPIARDAFILAAEFAAQAYTAACDAGISYQNAREILPNAIQTYIICEYPLREFLNVYAYRACVMFDWQIVHVMREMGRLLVEAHPFLAPYVKISCEKAKQCTFQGWERVEGFCDFPWAIESERAYKPPKELSIG